MLRFKKEYTARVPVGKVIASFTCPHVVLAMLLFDLHGKLGRLSLCRNLGITKRSLQTLLSRLKLETPLIQADPKRAHVLTMAGQEHVNAIKDEFTLIGNLPGAFPEFTFSSESNALGFLKIEKEARPLAPSISPMQLLRAAQDVSCKGLSSFIVGENRTLNLLAIELDVRRKFTNGWERLNEIFPLENATGNIIFIASANNPINAKLGIIAASLEALEWIAKNLTG